MILVKNIEIHSLCEHHITPFIGSASIAYIPRSKVSLGVIRVLFLFQVEHEPHANLKFPDGGGGGSETLTFGWRAQGSHHE